jgi:hypothetical protein
MSYNDDNQGGYGGGDNYGNEGRQGGYSNEGRQQGGYSNEGRQQGGYSNEGRQQGNDGEDYRSGSDARERQEHQGRRDDYYGGDNNSSSNNQQYNNNEGRQGNDDEFSSAAQHAQAHGNSSDAGFFSQALGALSGNKQNLANQDVDEGQAVQAHQQLYQNGGQGGNVGSSTIGAGAAMNALKMFTGGGAGQGGQGSQGGGNSQNQFIGMAMAEAGKMFDQQSGQGNVVSLFPFSFFSFFFLVRL